MWNWVKNAYNTAKTWVKGAVSTVKKAAEVIETVNNSADSAIQKVSSPSYSSTTTSKKTSDWKTEYNNATDSFVGNV